MTGESQDTKGQPGTGCPSVSGAAVFGLCPRCGARTLFAGLARFAPRCRACGLDFAAFNVGDGPAAFLTLIIGALITGLALWLQVAVAPPFWVHVLLWTPITTVAVIWGLRVAKGALLAAEFQRQAVEAKRKD